MFSRAASLSKETKQHKLNRLRPPSPWTNDLADEGVAVFIVQARNFTNMDEITTIWLCFIINNKSILLINILSNYLIKNEILKSDHFSFKLVCRYS